MGVFGRRHTSADSSSSPPESEDARGAAQTGKGRPTPKRREAELARKQRVKPPLTRREQIRRDRKQTRTQRARTRQAMETGDERHFLARDQGPVRKFVRDYIDSRRTVAEYFLPIVVVILLTSFLPSAQLRVFSSLLMVTTMLVMTVDLTFLGLRVKREVRRRFGDDAGRGHVFYAITRATQIRRWRLPKPTVKPGASV